MNGTKLWFGLMVTMLLAGCDISTSATFYPVVRTSMPGGYSMASIRRPMTKDACEQANTRFVAPIKSDCAECKVVYAGCDVTLPATEKALLAGEAVGQYAVAAGTLHLLLTGPEAVTKPVCEQMVADLVKKGTAAKCLAPGTKQ